MAAYFFDSSALVKRYTKEVGTTWIVNLFRPSAANRIYVARITSVEVISALTRRTRAGSLSDECRESPCSFPPCFCGQVPHC